MIIPETLLRVWFALAALSTAYVAWDNFVRGNPEETVMKWGWVLITLYMGPVVLALYVLTACVAVATARARRPTGVAEVDRLSCVRFGSARYSVP